MQKHSRPLTHDEKKGAEAAFRGAPFDPKWSEAARKVYLGISAAMANKRNEAFQDIQPARPAVQIRRTVSEPKQRSRAKSILW